MDYIYGVLNFENDFLFQKDILGNCIKTKINGVEVKLLFPRISPNIDEQIKKTSSLSSNEFIIAPNLNITNFNSDFNWGYLKSYPDLISHINNIIIAFPSGNEDEICDHVEEWLNVLFKYCKLISKIIMFHNNPNSIIMGGPLRLFSIIDNKYVKINRNYKSNPLKIYLTSETDAITLEQLTLAAKLASNRPIYLEEDLMLSAYNELENKNYRKCVIEAGTALEVLLTKVIKEKFKEQKILWGDKLLSKYQTLRGRFELLNILEISIPTKDYQDNIIKPRNIAVHGANPLTKNIALLCINDVQKYFDTFSPLE